MIREQMSSLPSTEATLGPTPATRERWLHLSLVFLFAFGVPIYLSVSEFTGHHVLDAYTAPVRLMIGNVRGLISLALMYFLLARQGRRMREIVGAFKWTDLLIGLVLLGATRIAILIAWLALDFVHWMAYHSHAPWWNNPATAFGNHATAATILFLINNPLAEEIISRAYVLTEVDALTKSPEMAVVTCFVLQFTYHLYQGIWNAVVLAVGMLCFSIFYMKTRRAFPNIFAHFYMDAWFLLR